MRDQNRGFHKLFRAGTVIVGLAALFIVARKATAQRIWGNSETLLIGPAAAVPLRSESAPDPLNPAANSHVLTGVEASHAVPMGVRELAVRRIAGRAELRSTAMSFMVGRLGFDRLVQHRISFGASRITGVPDAVGGSMVSVGVRGTLDGFSSPGRPVVVESAVTAGSLARLSDALDVGLVVIFRDADVHGSRAIDVHTALGIRLGRFARAGFGWTHATARPIEAASAFLLESPWGASLTAGIGGGASNAGVSLALRTGGFRIEMAWVRTGPAGATRFFSAGLIQSNSDPDE